MSAGSLTTCTLDEREGVSGTTSESQPHSSKTTRVQGVSFEVQPTKPLGFGSAKAVCFYCVDCLTWLQVHKELEIHSVKEKWLCITIPFPQSF